MTEFAAIRRALGHGYERYGRVRVNILLGFAVFVLAAWLLALLSTTLLVTPEVEELARAARQRSDAVHLATQVNILLIIGLLAAAGFALLWYGMLLPLERFRGAMRARLAEATPQDAGALQYWYARRGQQLEAALGDNTGLREQLARCRAELRNRDGIVNGVLALSMEPVVLTDTQGKILDASQAAAETIGWHRDNMIGRDFDAVVRLFEQSRPQPREYPVTQLVQRVIESGSAVPRIENALLVTRQDREHRAVITAVAILGPGGNAIGAVLRLAVLAAAGAAGTTALAPFAAASDDITGLLTRVSFNRRLDELLGLARLQQVAHVLLLLRFDHLDHINEEHGFGAADQFLWRAAEILRREVGDAGDCYQVSSTRFGALLGFCDAERGHAVAARIRESLASGEFVWQGRRFAGTASIVVVPVTERAEGHKQLVDMAEDVLRDLRRAGGNAVRYLAPSTAQEQQRRTDGDWVAWLDARFHDGRMHLISQLITPLADTPKARTCVESFLRVEDDDGVWVSPGAFLPALERRNQTSLLDLWVLRSTLDQVEAQPGLLDRHDSFGINLSMASLTESDFAERVCRTLGSSVVPAERICFEIEERAAAEHATAVDRFVRTVTSYGARVAIDQCRAGLGIELLRRLPIARLKFHYGLVKRALLYAVDRAQLQWLVATCRLLGRQTVACGVEREDMVAPLSALGLDYVQGVAVNKMGPLVL
jgi:diguanylate cyclase (GGDEF)-like protein